MGERKGEAIKAQQLAASGSGAPCARKDIRRGRRFNGGGTGVEVDATIAKERLRNERWTATPTSAHHLLDQARPAQARTTVGAWPALSATSSCMILISSSLHLQPSTSRQAWAELLTSLYLLRLVVTARLMVLPSTHCLPLNYQSGGIGIHWTRDTSPRLCANSVADDGRPSLQFVKGRIDCSQDCISPMCP